MLYVIGDGHGARAPAEGAVAHQADATAPLICDVDLSVADVEAVTICIEKLAS